MLAAKPTPTMQNVIVRFDQVGEADDMVSLTSTHWLTGRNSSLNARRDPLFGGARWEGIKLAHDAVTTAVLPTADALRELLLTAQPARFAEWGMTLDPFLGRNELFEAKANLADGMYQLVLESDVATPVALRGSIDAAPMQLRDLLNALTAASA